MTELIVRFDIDHLNYIEKPAFYHALSLQIEDEELICESAVKIEEGKLDAVREAFRKYDVGADVYRVEAVDRLDPA